MTARRPPAPTDRPATLGDVARLAGVSPMTASRVVNREPGVSETRRAKVLRAVEMLDYRPNLNARVLAGDRSYLIGLFCERPGNYLSEFQAGATERCRDSGYHLMVEPWDRESPQLAQRMGTLLRQLRLDGVVLLPPLCDDVHTCNVLREAGVPMVRIEPREPHADAPSIGIDDYRAARRMTAHLLDLGHRRIAFMLGRPGHGASEKRFRGFTDEMQARGVPVDHRLVGTGHFQFAEGVACAEALLRGEPRPTAVFACNDDMAAAAVSVAHRLGLDLPAQLSVVGFDDSPIASMIWPLLTTVRRPIASMARTAVELIIGHSPRRSGWPTPVPTVEMSTELVLRDSSVAPPGIK